MILALALLGCGPKPPVAPATPEPAEAVSDRVVPGSLIDGGLAEMPYLLRRAATVVRGSAEVEVPLTALATAGRLQGTGVYGATEDAKGTPIPWPESMENPPPGTRVCNVIDYGALLQNDFGWFHVGHLECVVGGVWVSPVNFAEDGSVSLRTPHPADFSAVGGTTTNCAGDITAWGTQLSSEEYEANARNAGPDGLLPAGQMSMDTKHPYEWSFLNEMLAYQPEVSPYLYGWIPEVMVTDAKGHATAVKHYAMGRFSHELARVMPDQRTVYLSDDQYHGAFFLFVADAAGDLSAGTLYAARFTQETGTELAVDWVSLGHATDAQVAEALANKVQFADLLEVQELGEDNTCPEGFSRSTHTWGTECLKAKDAVLASRLESRRVAGMLGATTELSKSEGIAFDPEQGALYLATSKISTGMLEEQTEARGPGDYRRTEESDHLRLEPNACGMVWRMDKGEATDRDGAAIDSPWVMRTAAVALAGEPIEGGCSEGAIANPDNLTFAPEYGWLIVGEDTKAHATDVLWTWDARTPGSAPIRLAEVDGESEVTGIHWTVREGQGWLTLSNQWDPDVYPNTRSVAALMGPFPLSW